MKKKITALFVLSTLLFLYGCGGNKARLNDGNIKIAKEIIKSVDAYLDGNIDAADACDHIEEKYQQIDKDDDTSKSAGTLLSSSALIIKLDLSAQAYDLSGDVDKIIAQRDYIAEMIGEPKYQGTPADATTKETEMDREFKNNDYRDDLYDWQALYEKAEFEKYKEPASVNGLDGTLISVKGTVVTKAPDSQSDEGRVETFIISDYQDHEWVFSCTANTEILPSVGDKIVAYGQYLGAAGAYENRPGCYLIRYINTDSEKEVYNTTMQGIAAYEGFEKSESVVSSSPTPEPTQSTTTEATLAPKPAADASPSIEQSNALKSAKGYLDFGAFSHSGLIEQLEYEGFSTEAATYAADNCGADWNEQAAKSAQGYLDFSSFSRAGLIEQLEYEGYTPEQAEYGVTAVGY